MVSHTNHLLPRGSLAHGLSHNDAMVISCVIKGFLVHNVLVDTGSAPDIIFAKAFRQMQEPDDKYMMQHTLFVVSEEDRLWHSTR
jgi:hypothetical protein